MKGGMYERMKERKERIDEGEESMNRLRGEVKNHLQEKWIKDEGKDG